MGRIKLDERTLQASRKTGRMGARKRWRGTTRAQRVEAMRAIRAESAAKQRAAKALREAGIQATENKP